MEKELNNFVVEKELNNFVMEKEINNLAKEAEAAGVSHETGDAILAQASGVVKVGDLHEADLSEPVKEKKSFLAKILDRVTGNAPLSPKEDAAVEAELLNHKNWNVKAAYEDAQTRGLADKYRKAYKRKGLPLYLNETKDDYTGQSFVAQ